MKYAIRTFCARKLPSLLDPVIRRELEFMTDNQKGEAYLAELKGLK